MILAEHDESRLRNIQRMVDNGTYVFERDTVDFLLEVISILRENNIIYMYTVGSGIPQGLYPTIYIDPDHVMTSGA